MKKRILSIVMLIAFSLTILNVFADTTSTNTNQTSTVSDTVYSTTYSSTYDTATTTSTTYSTTYGNTYNNNQSGTIIPPISDDNTKLTEGNFLTKEQKRNILNLIMQINTLKMKFNKTNAEVNFLRAKINAYIKAAQLKDHKFFSNELKKSLEDLNKTIQDIQKQIKNGKKIDVEKLTKDLQQKLNEYNTLRDTYQKQETATVNQAVYNVKVLLDQIQPTVKAKQAEIEAINTNIKNKVKEYEQAKKDKNYNSMVTKLNDLIALYNQKVNKINEIKTLYTNISDKINITLKNAIPKIKLPSIENKDNKNNEKKENKKENEKGKGKGKR